MSLGSTDEEPQDIDTSKIRNWRSIVTLIVFVLTSTSSGHATTASTAAPLTLA
jgi:Flp pilus assembly protein protease CpaA